MEAWKEEYKKLNIIDKIRFHWRVRQEEKLEDKRQSIEGDDRQVIDRMKIATELRMERENRKNKVKALGIGEPMQYKEPENRSEDWKVDIDPVQATIEEAFREDQRKFDYMLGKELNSEKDVYENIIEIQRFLSYPHDHIPNAADMASQKFEAISKNIGADVLERGMEIAQMDQDLIKMQEAMPYKDREKMRNEIINNPNLANSLNYLRYNPKEANKQSREIVGYQAVYAKMIEEIADRQSREQKSTDLNDELRKQNNSEKDPR